MSLRRLLVSQMSLRRLLVSQMSLRRLLVSQMSLRRLFLSQMSLRRLLVSQMSLRGALLTQDLVCGELGNAAVSCRELVNAAVSCEDCCWRRPILRSTLLHRWARGSDSRGHGDAQARRQERDIVTQRSVRTEVLILLGWESGPFYIFSATSRPRNQLRRW